jgi:hypothetical protein
LVHPSRSIVSAAPRTGAGREHRNIGTTDRLGDLPNGRPLEIA